MKRFPLILLPLLLAACSSEPEKKTPPLMSQRMADRLRRPDLNKRSVYEKSMQTTMTRGKDTGGWLGRQKYKAATYQGGKAYTNTPDYQTGSFSGADARSPMGSATFAQKDKQASGAGQSFQTRESRLAGQTAREGSQDYRDGGTVFKTRADREALKSQKKNVQPEFIELEEQRRNPAYSEEQVRKLLGRD